MTDTPPDTNATPPAAFVGTEGERASAVTAALTAGNIAQLKALVETPGK